MFVSIILLFSFIKVAFAKLDAEIPTTVPHVKISPQAGGVVVDGFSYANNLTMPCNNKFCEMLKYTAVSIDS